MTGYIVLALYVGAFLGAFLVVSYMYRAFFARADFTSLKTVTFGDESAVKANRVASVLSVLTIFLLWVAFTNSNLPLPKAPSPFLGDVTFTYTSTLSDGRQDDAEVTVRVYREDISQTLDADGKPGKIPEAPEVEPGDGFAKNDS
ncbi:MAG: ABC transporter permease, partial [Pseudomonadota bacterium]